MRDVGESLTSQNDLGHDVQVHEEMQVDIELPLEEENVLVSDEKFQQLINTFGICIICKSFAKNVAFLYLFTVQGLFYSNRQLCWLQLSFCSDQTLEKPLGWYKAQNWIWKKGTARLHKMSGKYLIFYLLVFRTTLQHTVAPEYSIIILGS